MDWFLYDQDFRQERVKEVKKLPNYGFCWRPKYAKVIELSAILIILRNSRRCKFRKNFRLFGPVLVELLGQNCPIFIKQATKL